MWIFNLECIHLNFECLSVTYRVASYCLLAWCPATQLLLLYFRLLYFRLYLRKSSTVKQSHSLKEHADHFDLLCFQSCNFRNLGQSWYLWNWGLQSVQSKLCEYTMLYNTHIPRIIRALIYPNFFETAKLDSSDISFVSRKVE